MANYGKLFRSPVPQSEPQNARQIRNNAGGYVYELGDFDRLERFLILGSDSSTYYQKAKKLTKENTAVVQRCWESDPTRTVETIVKISQAGRAPKNDPAIFALAVGATLGAIPARRAGLGAINLVCRTSTHLFAFVTYARSLGRGWGPTLRRAVARWYEVKDANALAYQAIKYRSRAVEGERPYTHKRLLQTAHPLMGYFTGSRKQQLLAQRRELESTDISDVTNDLFAKRALYNWLCEKPYDEHLPMQVQGHLDAMGVEESAAGVKMLVRLIEHFNLPWEALPTWANTKPEIWEALGPRMGMTALIRNLGNMTRVEAIRPLGSMEKIVVERLTSEQVLKRARVHPFNLLYALKTYESGKGFRGTNAWDPSQPICEALEKAFYLSFKTVQPTGKRIFIGIDVSGSMSAAFMNSNLEVAEAAAAMALTVMKTEKQWYVMGFANGLTDLKFKPSETLESVLKKTRNVTFGGTDCSLPMQYALQYKLDVDCFVVITDNETWAGKVHPDEALRQYRKATNIPAKLVVIGMTSTGFMIADPNDGGMMDVVGFDTDCPSLIADFIRK
jgi:60 kDa SS-A/Ro ribonucleoprotein